MRDGFLGPTVESIATRIERGAAPALHEAAKAGNLAAVVWLVLSQRVDVDGLDARGETALVVVARYRPGDSRLVKLLVALGANPSARDARGRPALHLFAAARASGSLASLRALAAAPSLRLESLMQPDAEGHLAFDRAGSLEAQATVKLEILWRSLGPEPAAKAATFAVPCVLAMLAGRFRLGVNVFALAAIVGLDLSVDADPDPRADRSGGLLRILRRVKQFGVAAASHPRSKLGAGAAFSIAASTLISTSAMLNALRACAGLGRYSAAYDLACSSPLDDRRGIAALRGSTLFVAAVYLALYARCAMVGPRREPRIDGLDRSRYAMLARSRPAAYSPAPPSPGRPSFCPPCAAFPGRFDSTIPYTHCSRCRACIPKRDHHCVLLDRCVGAHNRASFVALLAATLLCGVAAIRVAAWFFVLHVSGQPFSETDAHTRLRAHPFAHLRRAIGGALGTVAALHFILVPVGCIFVAYSCSVQLVSLINFDVAGPGADATAPPSDENDAIVGITGCSLVGFFLNPEKMCHAPSEDEQDAKHAAGMLGSEGEDWSKVPHSQRKDRPLAKDVLRELQLKSDLKGFGQLAGNMALIIAGGAVNVWLWRSDTLSAWTRLLLLAPSVLWQGFLLSALGFACQHECIHLTAFKTRKLNDYVGFWSSVPSFTFYYHEFLMHKEHHTHTQDIRRDPELVAEFAGMSYAGAVGDSVDLGLVAAAGRNGFKKVPMTRSQYVMRFLAFPAYLKGKIDKLWRCANGDPVDYSCAQWLLPVSPGDSSQPGTPAYRLKVEARRQLAITFALLALFAVLSGFDALVLAWLLPAFVGPGPLYACQLHEHANAALDPDDGLSNTRTVVTNHLVAFCMWNMNYHAEHHLYTTIPFHALPKAHEHLKDKLKNVSNDGHIGVHRRVIFDWIPAQQDALANAMSSKKVA
ncbi:hypothetical protein CTAYLR_004817 [Chrysophaeum taylorii]|uniref:Palmitoyltransferase n=1 Tax=Chrysophaeum taylorii TaxID=2483200 RepID=A0AAD7UMS3_9STRA|nr:hypothetical protein CTAYLR_004817 [Chrysophaeum taylorii]